MSVTQYVGARYVPLFAEPLEWDSDKPYEPLTIVTHEGNSYTSRQYVPSGIQLEDEQYWVLTGNFNAQVEQYRREVAELSAKTDKNEADISNIDNELEELKTKKIVWIGDSYSDPNISETTAEFDWVKSLSNKTGWDIFNYAKSGNSFYSSASGYGFLEQVEKAVSEHGADNVTDIVIFGGHNDMGTVQNHVSEITEHANTMSELIKKTWPSAKVHLFLVNSAKQSRYRQNYFINIVTNAMAYSIGENIVLHDYVSAVQACYNGYRDFAGGNYHPNTDCCYRYIALFTSAINGGSFKPVKSANIELTEGITTSDLDNIYVDGFDICCDNQIVLSFTNDPVQGNLFKITGIQINSESVIPLYDENGNVIGHLKFTDTNYGYAYFPKTPSGVRKVIIDSFRVSL